MEFEEYNGWPNFPTWEVFSAMSSYYETYQELGRIADRSTTPNEIKRFVVGAVEAWKANRPTPHKEATHILVQDFLSNGVRRVDWTAVYDTLRGERAGLGDADEVTALAYTLLSQTDWESIVEEAEYLIDADSLLRDWLQDQCITWVESPDARRHRGHVAQFANTVLDIYFSVVAWGNVTRALKSN
jgi:hypothetical protein